jgi:Tol biopolymer transport system component
MGDVYQGVLSADPVTLGTSVGAFSISSTGIVAHRAAGDAQLPTTWFDRMGAAQNSLGVWFNGPELSPDGRRLAGDRTIDGNRDVWVVDLSRGGPTRMTTDPGIDGFPLCSPDGEQMAFHSNRNETIDLWIMPSNRPGAEQRLLPAPDSEWVSDWSKDGRFLLYQRSDLQTRWDLWALPMTGTDRTPFPVANTPFLERLGEFSPDARWIAYETDESGPPEIVAQAFPEARERIRVSTAGGTAPRWSADGREIYFVAPDKAMMAVTVVVKGSTLQLGTPEPLFRTRIASQTFKHQYAVSSDGRFLVNNAAEITAQPITVILNVKPF